MKCKARLSSALGKKTSALGRQTSVVSKKTSSLGKQTSAVSKKTSALGKQTSALGKQTSALGKRTSAMSKQTSVLGKQTSALGKQTPALGKTTSALGKKTSVLGKQSTGSSSAPLPIQTIHCPYEFFGKKHKGYPNVDLQCDGTLRQQQEMMAATLGKCFPCGLPDGVSSITESHLTTDIGKLCSFDAFRDGGKVEFPSGDYALVCNCCKYMAKKVPKYSPLTLPELFSKVPKKLLCEKCNKICSMENMSAAKWTFCRDCSSFYCYECCSKAQKNSYY